MAIITTTQVSSKSRELRPGNYPVISQEASESGTVTSPYIKGRPLVPEAYTYTYTSTS